MSTDECSISSEGYLINHIDDYMEQFGMMKSRRGRNELFYLNVNPFRSLTLERSRLVRNLSYTVDIPDSGVKITLESSVILQFVISIGLIIIPCFLLPLSEVIIFPIVGLVFYLIHYLVKVSVLNQFKKEVESIIRELD